MDYRCEICGEEVSPEDLTMVDGKLMCPNCFISYNLQWQKDKYPKVRKLNLIKKILDFCARLFGYSLGAMVLVIYLQGDYNGVTAADPVCKLCLISAILMGISVVLDNWVAQLLRVEIKKHLG